LAIDPGTGTTRSPHHFQQVKIATYNVNGVNGRLPVLLQWLQLTAPDIVCLQELKASQESFPERAIRDAGYEAAWHGQSRWNGVAILSRVGEIHETRRSLPGDPDDVQSRYIEAAVNGVLIASLYLPNGNPRPGPKFDFKLRWIDRLHDHLATLIRLEAPVVVAGDFNVMPSDLDVYAPDRWRDDALFAPEMKAAFARLLEQGWIDALRRVHPNEAIYTFWKYWRFSFERDAGLRIDHILLNALAAARLKDAQVDREPRSWEKTSDHAPVWIDLADKPVQRRM
jgi:exodeoxyribonuclease-3